MNLTGEQQDYIVSVLEDMNVPESSVREILIMIEGMQEAPHEVEASSSYSTEDIKARILQESDWRKRASLSALLISRGL